MADIVEILCMRRSVRSFQDRLPEPETLHRLLVAAMAAPTACNSQPWEFLVVTEPQVMDKLRDKMPFARYNAPCAVIVCGNVEIAHNTCARHYWIQDCSAAMENLLVAAAGLEMGGVWCGVYPLPSAVKAVQKLFNMPEHVTPLGIAMLGYPADGAIPQPRKYEALWKISDIFNALTAAGLRVTYLGKHPDPYYDIAPNLPPELLARIPLTFSMLARKIQARRARSRRGAQDPGAACKD